MRDHFICSVCGIRHEGLITDRAYKLPDDVWSIPEAERSQKAKFDSDLCQLGERFFMRCVLRVPFSDCSGAFGWGVWAEVDWPTFERYLDLYEVDGSAEPAHRGLLANEIPGYPQSLGKGVLINFGTASKRPTICLTSEDDSQLAEEQRRGMDHTRHLEIIASIEAAN
ncbi:DUF2199 domain-containing protein [Rhizobiales bacterium RZME27]|uniref:DUF2199 domain-containing protein n=1 Tax=Endobacterium cereale TaxID=2663029 RepID=A0A6A8ACX9_9HYPH|nr:DUF2199 domain-containing protein [Endobacterium cereale]MEB2847011.1 DUF2199 domain-containing protein [Endobacterium cereale]MQY47570.1 DUF2199 domain-containing protein [Endobacterium cereale]